MKRIMQVLISLLLSILFLSQAGADQHSIRILYVNDFHGFAEPYKPAGSDTPLGGIAYLSADARRLRAERPTLLLAAGDMISGNNWSNFSEGRSVIEVMNEMKFDAMTLGNHEFDFGRNELSKRIKEAQFPVLGANVTGLEGARPYIVNEVGGVRVGIIGAVTEDTPEVTHPRNVEGLGFGPPPEAVRKYIEELRGKIDIIVVLSHIGYAYDRELAAKVAGIDVIVGGHSHTKLDRPVEVNGTIIVQAWEHAKALGVLDLTIRDGKIDGFTGHLDEIRPFRGGQDKTVAGIVDKYTKMLDKKTHEEIGTARVDLDGENVRRRETNLGDLVADVMKEVSGADLAITNGGGIRAGINRGTIRVKDVYDAFPFDSYIVAIKLTGKQIREVLENGVSAIERGEGRFPQVSGLKFTFSVSPGAGFRVRDVLIGGLPLDPDREYVVATNDFMAAGGDGYRTFGNAVREAGGVATAEGVARGKKVVYSDTGRWLRDVMVSYIRRHREISSTEDERIIEVR